MRTALITGSSTGIGRKTAELFASKGWRVLASMRQPSLDHPLAHLPNVELIELDVTKQDQVQDVFQNLIKHHRRLDAVINNAGYGVFGPFESSSLAEIEQEFATNVVGLMAVTQAALPLLRAHGGGNIVNISSVGGKTTTPLYSTYHATKWAVEGFSESLAREVAGFGIRIKVVEPGVIKTDFYGRSRQEASPSAEYSDLVSTVLRRQHRRLGGGGATPDQIAQAIYRAATSQSAKLRYPGAGGVRAIFLLRKLLPESLYLRLQQRLFG